jgi:hypothetical protein
MNDQIETSEPKLTKKEREFLKEYFKTGNGTLSALKVYDTDNYASASEIASQNLRRLKNPMRMFMEANGFSLKVLLSVLAGGLQATKLEDLSGEKVPDHSVRHKFLTTASKWMGLETEQAALLQQINIEKPIPLIDPNPLLVVRYADNEGKDIGWDIKRNNGENPQNIDEKGVKANIVELTNFRADTDVQTIDPKELSDEELEDIAKTTNG